VALTTIAERIVRPGCAAEYVSRVGEVFERLRLPGRASRLLVVVSDECPDHVISLGEWENVHGLEDAYAGVPKEILDAVDAVIAERPNGLYRVYQRLRSVERMLERSQYLVAIRLRVAPTDAGTFESWARGFFDADLLGPQVVSVRLLRACDEPGAFLVFAERNDHGAGQLAEFLARNPPPVSLLEQSRFVGRIDGHWEPPTPLPTATYPLTRAR
jgi:hypothetical protein